MSDTAYEPASGAVAAIRTAEPNPSPWFGNVAIAMGMLTVPALIALSFWAGEDVRSIPASPNRTAHSETAPALAARRQTLTSPLANARLRLTPI